MVRRRFLLIVFLAIAVSTSPLPAQDTPPKRSVDVHVDPRVELMSIIFRLAGNPEYGRGQVKPYLEDVEKHFGSLRSHEAVQWAAQLRRTRGVSYDACMGMAVHLDPHPDWHLRLPLDPAPGRR